MDVQPALIRSHVARKIREVREEHRLTQEELAAKSGISRTTIANLEKEYQGLSIEALYKLCSALNVSFSELLPPTSQVVKAKDATYGGEGTLPSDGLPAELMEKLDDLTGAAE